MDQEKITKIIQEAKEKYPGATWYKGQITPEERAELEKVCHIHTQSVYMDGTGMYDICWKKEDVTKDGKPVFRAVFRMTQKQCDFWNECLDMPAPVDFEEMDIRTDSTVDMVTAEFENGCFADIKLCAGQNNFFGDNVLFDADGYETCVPDCFDRVGIRDEFVFETKDAIYIGTVIEKGEKEC